MIVEIKIPSPGESITEVELANWFVEDGEYVEKDQEIAEIESDKATLTLNATESGAIKLIAQPGDTLEVGDVACSVDTSKKGKAKKKEETDPSSDKQGAKKSEYEKDEKPGPEKQDQPAGKKGTPEPSKKEGKVAASSDHEKVKVTPLAQKQMKDLNLNVDDIINGLQKITSKEVKLVHENKDAIEAKGTASFSTKGDYSRETSTTKLSTLRKKISERLVQVKNETAMLTTFNEVDMSEVMKLRKMYQKKFVEKHGIKLGFMSFFTKAVTNALKIHPNVNAMLQGEELIRHDFADIGIAVQTPKGLMVPVIRNAESMTLADIEKKIKELADKARNNKITIEEITGGTFTITNGGIFGSLMSTPILNPPQSGILGMHNIVERPVAIDGKVEIRPMMYIALSYDHRVIDGKDSVSFLVKIKEMIESPHKMLLGGLHAEEMLLDL